MSSGQSSVSTLPPVEASPSRKRPLLPPINPSALPQHAKPSSPTSAAPSFHEARSSNVHGLLNHSEAQPRFTSESPASSAGPETPGTTLPPVNTLTSGRPTYPPFGSIDTRKPHFLNGPSPPTTTRAAFPALPRLSIQDDRRGSDASIFSNTSPTTSMTSSSFGQRQSPPINSGHAAFQNANGGYQFMTTGGLVVPLDTQQASRLADEKRKRNAGASARFRQRRKEKEKESAHSIARLESELRELQELNGWYRNERDHLRQICINNGLQTHIGARPPSPKMAKMTPPHSNVTTPSEWQQHGERGNDQGRNQRRRVGDYFEGIHIAHGQQSQGPSTNPHTSFNSSFGSAASSALPSPNTIRPSYEQQQQHHHERHYVTTR